MDSNESRSEQKEPTGSIGSLTLKTDGLDPVIADSSQGDELSVHIEAVVTGKNPSEITLDVRDAIVMEMDGEDGDYDDQTSNAGEKPIGPVGVTIVLGSPRLKPSGMRKKLTS